MQKTKPKVTQKYEFEDRDESILLAPCKSFWLSKNHALHKIDELWID